MTATASSHRRTLNVRDLTLFSVSAILLLDTLAASASIGVSSLFWWALLSLIFFVPYAMISAEMGTTYPEQGGIYAWVRDTFGPRWGTRVTWLYWLNNTLWSASVLVMFSGIFAALFFPEMGLIWKLVIAIVLNWLICWVACVSLDVGKWVPNVGATLKLFTFAALIAGGLYFAFTNAGELANNLTLEALKPEWGTSTQYIAMVIYGMVGFELMSGASEEMNNPARDVPKAIFLSALVIFLMYFFGTLAILLVVPVEEIDLVEGLIDTLKLVFGHSALGVATATTLGIFTLFTFFSNMTTWAIGTNRAIAEAAIDGEMPAFLGYESPSNGAPVGAAVTMATSIMVVLIVYAGLTTTNEELFWSLLAASGVLFMLPYVGAVAAFFRARQVDEDRKRPFRVPGGKHFARVISTGCIAMIGLTIFLFMYVPGSGFDWPVVAGSIVSILLGEVAMWVAERNRRDSEVNQSV